MHKPKLREFPLLRTAGFALGMILLIAGSLASRQIVLAEKPASAEAQTSPIHPSFPLLDENGVNVLVSGGAVSTMNTCGGCHDTAFIAEHSYHANVGLDELAAPGQTDSQRPWDISPGYFGKWNPIAYRYLSPPGDERIDLTLPERIQTLGVRHVGGGPAAYGLEGELLSNLQVALTPLESYANDPETGKLAPWDWEASGVVE